MTYTVTSDMGTCINYQVPSNSADGLISNTKYPIDISELSLETLIKCVI